MRADLQHLMAKYSKSDALMRVGGKPVYFVYDSYHIPAAEWATLLMPDGNETVRGTELDGGYGQPLLLLCETAPSDRHCNPG